MFRFLLSILLICSACAVVAHGTLVWQLSSTYALIAEEESSDEPHVVKEAKEVRQENMTFYPDLYRYAEADNRPTVGPGNTFFYCKGFYVEPYNPPESA